MTVATLGFDGALKALNEHQGGMSLQHWMELNRDEFLKQWGSRRLNWQVLCNWFKEVGLTNQRGQVANVGCAKMMWSRVGKMLAADNARREAEAEAVATRAMEREAEAEAALEAARAKRAFKNEQAAGLATRMEAAQNGAVTRAREIARPQIAPEPAIEIIPARSAEAVPGDDQETQRVKIGQVADVIIMRKQAPRYGDDRFKPLPEPYVGPRPDGMPRDLPLEALMPLTASGRQPNGNFDFEQMPGLPRRSFFETEMEWAQCCYPMLKAIPPRERNGALRGMFFLIDMKVNR